MESIQISNDTRNVFYANLGSLVKRRSKWNFPKYRKMAAPYGTSEDPFQNTVHTHPRSDFNRSSLLANEP